MTDGGIVAALARRDRAIVLALLAAVTIASWWYVLAGAGMGPSAAAMTRLPWADAGAMEGMSGMPGMNMGGEASAPAWSAGHAAAIFLMWWAMMAAMMLPSAAPAILLFAGVNRGMARDGGAPVSASVFAAGYLSVWGGFSLAATALHWALARIGLLNDMMESASVPLAAALLVAAGLWQLTPLKRACLSHCRSPLHFLAQSWRPGPAGAFRMGVEHGFYCLGCCWLLMALLFVGGVMNLFWIGALALIVFLEKTVLALWASRALGFGLIAGGVWLAARAV